LYAPGRGPPRRLRSKRADQRSGDFSPETETSPLIVLSATVPVKVASRPRSSSAKRMRSPLTEGSRTVMLPVGAWATPEVCSTSCCSSIIIGRSLRSFGSVTSQVPATFAGTT
jgi:hypothetical protein